MFGLKLYQEKYVTALEREVEYWRNLFNDERLRGDRLQDGLLVQVGQLPATETFREVSEAQKKQSDVIFATREAEIKELFSDSMDEMAEDDLELPEELKESAKLILEEQ